MATYTHDVVVFGNTMCGLMAAKAAAAQGRTVAVVAENGFAGGMTRSGLCYMDYGSGPFQAVLGGFTKSAFLDRIDQIYGKPANSYSLNPEPKTVTTIVNELLGTAGVQSFTGKTLVSVAKSNSRIISINAGVDTFNGSQFIDASYEGELMNRAGVTNTFGREAQTTYGEWLKDNAGTGIAGFASKAGPQAISVLDSNGQRIYGSGPIPRADIAAGDAYNSVQAMNFRIVLTNTPAKKRTIQQPAGYKASDYQVLLNFLGATAGAGINKLVGPVGNSDAIFGGGQLLTNDGAVKYDCNRSALVSSNLLTAGFGKANISWAYPTSSRATRIQIATEHYRWLCGLIYFCQNDTGLGALRPALQTDANTYAFCTDEFSSNFLGQAGFPSELYVRECRRLVGQYVMTVDDVAGGARKADPVCRWGYSVDLHGSQRYPRRTNAAQWETEGGFNLDSPGDYYDIPWRSLLPMPGQANNLTVPWSISSTHLAWGAVRMELNGMMQGEAAGAAAHLAIQSGIDPVFMPYGMLRPALLTQGAII